MTSNEKTIYDLVEVNRKISERAAQSQNGWKRTERARARVRDRDKACVTDIRMANLVYPPPGNTCLRGMEAGMKPNKECSFLRR